MLAFNAVRVRFPEMRAKAARRVSIPPARAAVGVRLVVAANPTNLRELMANPRPGVVLRAVFEHPQFRDQRGELGGIVLQPRPQIRQRLRQRVRAGIDHHPDGPRVLLQQCLDDGFRTGARLALPHVRDAVAFLPPINDGAQEIRLRPPTRM